MAFAETDVRSEVDVKHALDLAEDKFNEPGKKRYDDINIIFVHIMYYTIINFILIFFVSNDKSMLQ